MIVSKNIIDDIFLQGEQESPLEACGYLAGTGDRVVKRYPLRNKDQSREHYSFEPKDQFAAIRQARGEGLEMLAVYHTHPATPARPSEEDIRLAFDPNIIYVIASLMPGNRNIRAFRIVKGIVSAEVEIIRE